MKKQTIGKVQLWIGIILLIVGIIGVIASIVLLKNTFNSNINTEFIEDDIEKATYITIFANKRLTYITLESSIGIGSIITMFISLLFITQGLVNKSEE
ncbi:hypothetical protein KBC25_04015 [Candidatus Pacearchaeota archaeon]|jgi:amino acid transporter|nr:hypothetical protein [Candidatus Pacearchaeota archaeon]